MAGQVERRMRFSPGTGRDVGRGESGIEVFPAGWSLLNCGADAVNVAAAGTRFTSEMFRS